MGRRIQRLPKMKVDWSAANLSSAALTVVSGGPGIPRDFSLAVAADAYPV
jgi:hypothetical protein